jgi:hypothetical protein
MITDYTMQREMLEMAVDDLEGWNRPRGQKWEDHRDMYLDFEGDSDTAAYTAARNALTDWYVAREVLREQILHREAILAAMDEVHQ